MVDGAHLHRCPRIFRVVPPDEALVEELLLHEGASDDLQEVACFLFLDELPQPLGPEDGERLVVSLGGGVFELEPDVCGVDAGLQEAQRRGDAAVLQQMPDRDYDVRVVLPVGNGEGAVVKCANDSMPIHAFLQCWTTESSRVPEI